MIPNLHESAHFVSELCVAGATLGILYNLVAAMLILRFESPSASQPSASPAVTILKPLHGGEPGLFPRLAAFCNQDYPQEVQLVCGTQLSGDKAIEAVRLLQRLHPNAPIDLVIDERSRGTNRKMANLANMESLARHELIVLSDSDIAVDNHFVSRIVAELEGQKAAAVTCVYYGLAAGGIWARASAMDINAQFLPNVIVALTFGAAKPCFGSAIAMRKTTLRRIGGLRSYLDELADDYAIGKAIRATGGNVVIPGFAVGHVCFERSFRAFWDHHIRSARTIRSIDPVGYVGIVFMHPLMLSLAAAMTGTSYPLALLALALVSRLLLVSSVERAFRLERESPWLLVLHDVMSFAVFVSSFFGRSVAWRDHSYRILPDGTIERDG
jgi:ceramide glucosyltransferase